MVRAGARLGWSLLVPEGVSPVPVQAGGICQSLEKR